MTPQRWARQFDVVTGNGLRVAHIIRHPGTVVADTWCSHGVWSEMTPEKAPGRSVSWLAPDETPLCRRCVERVERARLDHMVTRLRGEVTS